MEKLNVGTVDAALRSAVAVGLGFLSVSLNVHLLISLLIAMIAMGMGASAMLHYCPLYSLLGICTRHNGAAPTARHP
jgi:hypothetical protein